MPRKLPVQLTAQTVLPIIAAPMFLVSGPDLVLATCKEGIIGAFPAPNARTSEQLDDWMQRINDSLIAARQEELQRRIAPWAANIVTLSTYKRLQVDLELVVRHNAPIVITALGSPAPVVEAVHSYVGLVLADVDSISYAWTCMQVGVNGLILVCTGAGGHTGSLTAFTFLEAVREFWDGIIVLAGAYANMLRPSILRAGLDPDALQPKENIDFTSPHSGVKPWKDIWSAGQSVGAIKQI